MDEKIDQVISLINQSQNSINPNSFIELISRMEKIKTQYTNLMKLNTKYIEKDPMKMDIQFDEETGVMTVAHMGELMSSIKLNRANPEVPVKLASKSDMSSFVPSNENQEIDAIRNQIAEELESFYFNASKLWDLIEKTILSKSKSDFIGVKMVRNKLIEHTEDGDIYSFGASDEWGPTVKPSQLTSRKEKWHDKGLRVNTEELLNKIESRFTS